MIEEGVLRTLHHPRQLLLADTGQTYRLAELLTLAANLARQVLLS